MKSAIFYKSVTFHRVLTLLLVTLQGKSSWLNFQRLLSESAHGCYFTSALHVNWKCFYKNKSCDKYENGRHFCMQSFSQMNKNAHKSDNSIHLFFQSYGRF